MTHDIDSTALAEAMEQVIEHGMEGLSGALTILLNEAMKIERSRVLQASPWERTEQRLGYANGYKDKTLDTRLGRLQLSIPQVRGDVSFYPSALERAARFLNNDSTQPSITLQSLGRFLVDAAIPSRSGGFSNASPFLCRR